MNRKILLLNLMLAALAGVLIWQIRVRWAAARAHEREILAATAQARRILPPPLPAPAKAAAPADYLDVAQRTLFARDRNPAPIVDTPPPPPPPPPMPALPTYHGQMSLGEPVVILSTAEKTQKSYRVGDEIGPFRLVAFDRDNITFEWNGEPVERSLAELRPKENTEKQAQAATPAPSPAAAPAVQSLSSLSSTESKQPSNPTLGTDMGGGFRGCVAGDTSPAGTILDGYRKVVARTVMGSSCHWEQIK
jgi:hypothetical protein